MAERSLSRGPVEAETKRFLTFRAGGQLYALPSEEIREVVKLPALARVPLGPKALLGLGNLRGSVLPVAGLSLLLNRGSPSLSERSRVIVLEGRTPLGLLVEDVEAIVQVVQSRVLAPEATVSATDGELLKGVFRATEGDEPVKILDIGTLLLKAFASTARGAPSRATGFQRQSVRETTPTASEILIAFDVAGQEFAMPIASVVEVLPSPGTATGLPHSETAVIGMIGLRDTLLPLLSLRTLLGLAGSDSGGMVIVAMIGGAVVGLAVDGVREIIRTDPAALEPVPTVIASRTKGEAKAQSVIKLDGGKRLIAVLGPDQLFREDIMTRIRQQAPATTAPHRTAVNAAERIFLVFALGDQEYGLAISAVEEVARLPEQVTRLPRSPDFLKGVVNLRGAVLPIIDQRRRFDLPDGEDGEARRLVVVRIDANVAGFIVDGVSEVLRVQESAVEPPPEVVDGTRVLEGVLNLEQSGRMILLLDPSQLLTRTEKGLLDALGRVDEAQSAIDQSTGRG